MSPNAQVGPLLMVGRRKHSSADTLDLILVAARDAFAAEGFDGARLDKIGRSAGVSKQLVYHYFRTKEELYGVVLDRIAEEVHTMLDDLDYDRLTPGDAVKALIERIIQNYIDRPYLVGITLDQSLHKGEHVTRKSQYLPTVRKFVGRRVIPILDRGVAEGQFRAGVDPYLFYWSIFSLATGVFFQDWSMSETSEVDFRSDKGMVMWREHVSALVLGGLRAEALPG